MAVFHFRSVVVMMTWRRIEDETKNWYYEEEEEEEVHAEPNLHEVCHYPDNALFLGTGILNK